MMLMPVDLGPQPWTVKSWQLGTEPFASVIPELRLLLGTSVGSLLSDRGVKESLLTKATGNLN